SLLAADRASSGLVVAHGHEIADDPVADVGPALDDLFGGRPILVADLAGAEDMAAAPAALHVVAAREEFGVRGPFAIDGSHLLGIGGDVTGATPFLMATPPKPATRRIADL